MAAAYGYAGEFSSDDDERTDQYQERMVQTKFDINARPNKKRIEDEIEAIRKLPHDQDIDLEDDMLAGLLDYYKTQRGPIVDSTRKLYNKIALRLVRADQQGAVGGDGFVKDTTNGNAQQQPKTVIDNNNSINLIGKGSSQLSSADNFSSDDDDVEIVETHNRAKKFDGRLVYDNLDLATDDDNMDVDSETPSGPVRETKQVDLSTTDDDDSSSEESSSESEGELNSSSDVLEVTPIKPPASASREKEAVEVLMAMRPSTPKQAEASLKKNQMAHSTPKDSVASTTKKPYTRSQRVATRSATRSSRASEAVSKVEGTSSTTSDVFLQSRRVSRQTYTMVGGALVVVVLAFVAYFFRSSIMNTAEPLLRKKISF